MRPATEREKRILRTAVKGGIVRCRENEDVRLYMTALGRLSRKGFIRREATVAYLTDEGRAALL